MVSHMSPRPSDTAGATVRLVPVQRSFSPEQNERLRDVARELVKRFGNQRRVADAMGIRQPALSAFLLGKYGLGFQAARRLAHAAGLSEQDLFGASPEARAPGSDEYPNRALVLEVGKSLGVSRVALQKLAAARIRGEDDVPAVRWLRLLVRLEDETHEPFVFDERAHTKKRR
jgi:transcriptional regulator with XRE-family HTH domain